MAAPTFVTLWSPLILAWAAFARAKGSLYLGKRQSVWHAAVTSTIARVLSSRIVCRVTFAVCERRLDTSPCGVLLGVGMACRRNFHGLALSVRRNPAALSEGSEHAERRRRGNTYRSVFTTLTILGARAKMVSSHVHRRGDFKLIGDFSEESAVPPALLHRPRAPRRPQSCVFCDIPPSSRRITTQRSKSGRHPQR